MCHMGVNLCTYADVTYKLIRRFISQFINNELSFKTFIYNLGTRQQLWRVDTKTNSEKLYINNGV